MASGRWLRDMGPKVFQPNSEEPCERLGEYASAFIYDNEGLWTEMHRLAMEPNGDEVFFQDLTEGQRHLFVLTRLDGEISNGGIFQFFFNEGHLDGVVQDALEKIGANELLAAYREVVTEVIRRLELVQQARRVGEEDFKRQGHGPSRRAHSAYEKARVALEKWTNAFEGKYWSREARSLKVEMCSKLNEYIERHPNQFQILKH